MNAIRTIGILLASFALIGVAEAQKGGGKPGGGGGDTLANLNCSTDQIARFNGTAWVCSHDRTTSAPVYRVVDGNGTTLPYPIFRFGDSYDAAEVFADFVIEGQVEKVQVSIKAEGIYSVYGGQLFFETNDCTGTGYIYPIGDGHWFQQRAYTYYQNTDRLFYSDKFPFEQEVAIQSSTNGFSEECFDYGINPQISYLVPVVGSVPFEIPYVLPFTIVSD